MRTQNHVLSAKFAYSLVTIICLVFILHTLQGILVPIVFAVLFSLLLLPLCKRLERIGIPRILAIIVCIILVISCIIGLLLLVINQFTIFGQELPQYSHKLEQIVTESQLLIESTFKIKSSSLIEELKKLGIDALKNSGTYIKSFLSSTSSILANALIIPLYVFFMLLYRDFLKNFVFKLFPKSPKQKISNILYKIYEVTQGYLLGMLMVIGIVACLNTAGLFFLKVDYALFFGIFAAFLLLIPYVGIFIGAILPTLFALLTKDSAWYSVGVIAVFVGVQMLESNFITPYVVGSKVSINSLAAIVALLLGGQLWGMAGLVLALPITAIIKVIFDNIHPLKPYGYLLGDKN
jgi:predicted PurR-regulated permease PerM